MAEKMVKVELTKEAYDALTGLKDLIKLKIGYDDDYSLSDCIIGIVASVLDEQKTGKVNFIT